ncbi:MAG: hypothetical protein INR71_14920, partial [Terriglobus roseus]|nr:hypothetical protein [Terriglobus roseus]
PLAPPPASLLPPLTNESNPDSHATNLSHGHHHHHHHSHQRRARVPPNPHATLPALSADERQLQQRKLAIAMYGYSWVRPAGCAKTMLGMREEQLEREEVERQMREVEMQERMQAEADEMERRMEREAEGDMAGVAERDLDDEVPDAEEAEGWGSELDGDMDGEEGMQGDLDDDIPDADADEASEVLTDEEMTSEMIPTDSPARNEWSYDSRREPDTDEESGDEALQRIRRTARLAREQRQAGYQRRPGAPGSDYDVDERDAEALALAEEMLDEDEMGDISYGGEAQRDLDDSVPEAEEGEWEHTDTEDDDLDEEDMDISIMPNQARTRRSDGPQQQLPSSAARSPRTTRVVSGNAALGGRQREASGLSSAVASSTGGSSRARQGLRSQAQLQDMGNASQGSYETPAGGQAQTRGRGIPRTSMLLATESSAATTNPSTGDEAGRPGAGRRGWLNPASARRNLFGMSRGAGGTGAGTDANSGSSGGLFTPEAPAGQSQRNDFETPDQGMQSGSGRQTRSGRLIAGLGRRGRRTDDE